MITPYKERKLDPTKSVQMYRCLNRKGFVFSLKQLGLVVGHTSDIILKNCDLVVSEPGRQRVIKEKSKNVHAFVIGYIGSKKDIDKQKENHRLIYNPYHFPKFCIKAWEKYTPGKVEREYEFVEKASVVFINREEILCQLYK